MPGRVMSAMKFDASINTTKLSNTKSQVFLEVLFSQTLTLRIAITLFLFTVLDIDVILDLDLEKIHKSIYSLGIYHFGVFVLRVFVYF
jgi:hypothetical protein